MDNDNVNNNNIENNTDEKNNKHNNKKKILIIATMFLVVCCSLIGTYNIMNKKVTIVTNGKTSQVSTFKYTIGEAIKEQNIQFDEDDFVNTKLNEESKENVDLNTKLEDDMYINVINVSKGTISEYKEVEFKTIVEEDENLLKGKIKIDQEGENGRNNLVYDVVYHNGELIDKTFNKEIVSESPVNKVVKNGTKVESKIEDVTVASCTEVASSSSVNGKYMSVVATAYAGDTITATGTVPKWGTIAVDPKIIPYGTKVYIPQFNKTFIAEDCGGAIKGNKIDIFMNSNSSAYDWGRRTIDIYIVG